ncbi:hypothetical protein XBI1_280002 [Xenorhabdus bovienii str. Intermedium]|uniref:Uncharacterized protein n=1 Tax=Xenorhabdus bovienii str. Intermedium TaxID=1379677 RepID=A0A077QNF5_XENBV|nr:hypothetical protein XBI1_280002 [Xenorhabdus bovienii str. Intermedium]
MDQKVISVLKFYKTYRQTAQRLGCLQNSQTEMCEKNFSKFQFSIQSHSESLIICH